MCKPWLNQLLSYINRVYYPFVAHLVLYVLVLTLFSPSALAVEAIASLRISQAVLKMPTIIAYLDARNEAGTFLDDVGKDKLQATIGQETVSISDVKSFARTGDGVAYVFLIDVSKSLNENTIIQMREGLTRLVDNAGNKDRIAIMTFGQSVALVQNFTDDKTVLKAKIAEIKIVDDLTKFYNGVTEAVELARQADVVDVPDRRVILVLSDGLDDYTGGGGMKREEALNKIQTDHIPMYAIGYNQEPFSEEKDAGLKTMGEFARVTGGQYYDSKSKPLVELYDVIQQNARQVLVAKIDAGKATVDGNVQRLQVTLNTGTQKLTDGMDIRMIPTNSTGIGGLQGQPLLYGGLGIVFVIAVSTIFYVQHRKRQSLGVPPTIEEPEITGGDYSPTQPFIDLPEPSPPQPVCLNRHPSHVLPKFGVIKTIKLVPVHKKRGKY